MEFPNNNKTILLKITCLERTGNSQFSDKYLTIFPNMDCKAVTAELFKACKASPEKQVLKIRNSKKMLIPISFLMENKEPYYILDVATISCYDKSSNSLLQDAYVDSVCNKVKSLESRIAQAELLLPQLEWRRQAYMEETVSQLLNKVQFLSKRFDELYPHYKAGTLAKSTLP